MIDRFISQFDLALRTVVGVHRAVRETPATGVAEADLSDAEKVLAARLMRVNHCGEVCAQALYQGQALASDNAQLAARLDKAAREEEDHLAWSAERIREGVTGQLPLERVAPHAVGARERLFPTDETELRESGISGENPPKLPWAGRLPC